MASKQRVLIVDDEAAPYPFGHGFTVSELTTAAERAVAARLDANCQSPVASYATIKGGQMTVTALVASEDGRQVTRDSIVGNANEADSLGTSIAERLLASGAGDLLAGSSG